MIKLSDAAPPVGLFGSRRVGRDRLLERLSLAAICVVYLAVTLAYSLMTPAWEANDEAQHAGYVQHLLEHRSLPPLASESGHEAHQPPLYYALAALWQAALGVPSFRPDPIPREDPIVIVPGRATPELMLSHDYGEEQRTHARYLHLLRLLSVVLGLLTVLLTYVAARLATGRADVALAAAAFVALLPKLNVVSAVVTNDALVIPLSSLALVGTLAYVRAPSRSSLRAAALAGAVGLALGAATLSKLNALPLVPVLLGGLFLARASLVRRLRDASLAVAGWFAACSWWFLHNTREYGDPLAREATRAYLDQLVPSLIVPVPWFDTERFLYFVPQSLVETSWYNAGWNQLFAPFAVNLVLALVAAIAVFGGLRAFAAGRACVLWPLDRRVGLLLGGVLAAGLAAVLIVTKDTTQAQGRVMYIGMSAFATVAVLGLAEGIGGSDRARLFGLLLFPTLLLLLNVYALTHFVIPFRGP